MNYVLWSITKLLQLHEGEQVLSPTVNPTENLLKAVERTHYPLGSQPCLSSFVINTLFNILAATCFPLKEEFSSGHKLEIWFKSYRYSYNFSQIVTLYYFLFV